MNPAFLAPLPRGRLGICDLTPRQAAAIAALVVDRSGLATDLEFSLTARTGAPRRASWRALMQVSVATVIMRRPMRVSQIAKTADELRRAGAIDSPISYDQLWDGLHRIEAALDRGHVVTAHNHTLIADPTTGALDDCPPDCTGGCRISREIFSARLCTTSAYPDQNAPRSTTFAVDSTDLETWAARKSWDRVPDVEDRGDDEPAFDLESPPTYRSPGWPRIGHDGRLQHTLDPDAREGYVSGKNKKPKGVFCGYDEHIITPASEFGQDPIPHVAVGLVTAPAGSYKADAGILVLDALRRTGHDVKRLIADRGYTYLKPEGWALQLRARGVDSIHDLHTKQRGKHPGPIPGTVWIDGGLFIDCIPDELQDLPGFPLGLTPAAKAKLHADYDKRIPYAFAPQGDTDPKTGSLRMRGPALRGLVRCPNVPKSMRLGLNRPTTPCKKGKPCACGRTVMIDVTDEAWRRQGEMHREQGRKGRLLLWGTTEWAASYGRRVAVESVNAELRTNREISFARGYIRCRGAGMNHLLMTFTLTGLNVLLRRDWHITRLMADPWLQQIGDATDPDWAARHKHRARKPRKRALHELIAHNDIPRRQVTSTRGTQDHRAAARQARVAKNVKATRPAGTPPTSGPPNGPDEP